MNPATCWVFGRYQYRIGFSSSRVFTGDHTSPTKTCEYWPTVDVTLLTDGVVTSNVQFNSIVGSGLIFNPSQPAQGLFCDNSSSADRFWGTQTDCTRDR